MNIVICNDQPTAMAYIRQAWANVLAYTGYNVTIVDIRRRSYFDIFDQLRPDVIFAQGYNLSDGFVQCLRENPQTKVLLRVSDWSDWNSKLDKNKYPVLSANKKEIELIEKVRKIISPILHIHHHPDYLEQTHGNWLKEGYKLISIMNCADVFSYTNGQYKNEYDSDLVFCGGYWPYKAINLDKYILPFCNGHYRIKIFGNQNWGCPQYCGFIPEEETKHVLKSSQICLSVHEPHSTDFGYDIVTRPFNLLSNNCFCISDSVTSLKKIIPDGIIHADNPNDFKDKVNYFLLKEEERSEVAKKGYITVMKEHTSFDRIACIWEYLGLNKNEIIDAKTKFVEQVQCLPF